MEADTKANIVGRRARLVVRQPNGQVSIFTGVIAAEDTTSWTIKTDRGELRIEPKLYSAVEVL